MTNKKNLNDKNKSDETYRTDPPQGQPGIPDPPKFLFEDEATGIGLVLKSINYMISEEDDIIPFKYKKE